MTIQATASKLLTKLGEAVTLSYQTQGDIDPATGEGAPGTTVEVKGFGYPGQYKSADVDGTNVLSSDVRLTMENVNPEPCKGWKAVVDCKSYRVMNVRHIRKSGAPVITVCQLRSE